MRSRDAHPSMAEHPLPTPARLGLRFWLAVAAAALALCWGWRVFWFLTDDAFIHFRYVSNSLLGRGYVWNPPPFRPVEGYSSFLWVALLDGVWRASGVAPTGAANVLLLLFSLASLVVAARAVARMPLPERLERHRLALVALVLLGLVTNRTFVTWTSSGLETAMVNFWILIWVLAALRFSREALADSGEPGQPAHPARAGALVSCCAALIYLTRPEGLLFASATAAMIACVWIARAGVRGRTTAALGSCLPLLAVPAHLVWRHATYGEWLPNTYWAKHVGAWPLSGAHYLLSYTLEHALWFWMLACAVLGARPLARHLSDLVGGLRGAHTVRRWVERGLVRDAAVLTVLANAGYYTFVIGGDTFEYRIYSHLVPLFLLALVWLLAATEVAPARALATLGAFVVLGCPIAWTHWRLALDVPHEQAAGEDVSVPIAGSLPPGLRWYGALFDRSQDWLVRHLVCGRHHSHVHFTQELLATHPTREYGLSMPWEGLPVYVIDAVGVPGWTLPNVAILDRHGLNDHVVARVPLPANHVRQMAHDRSAPRDYVAEFRPNVRLLPEPPFVRVRERKQRPLSDEDVRDIERRWWELAREWTDSAGEH